MEFDCGCYVSETVIHQCSLHKGDLISNSIIFKSNIVLGEGPTIVQSYSEELGLNISSPFPSGPDRSVRLAHDKNCHCERCEPK